MVMQGQEVAASHYYGLIQSQLSMYWRLQVLYNLFEWPMRKGSRLAVIGVANTMDLPERLLPRIASRLGSRLPHHPPLSPLPPSPPSPLLQWHLVVCKTSASQVLTYDGCMDLWNECR